MKITVLTVGTRGDVEPFVAFACGLQRVGHDVTLAAPDEFAEMVRERVEIRYAPVHLNLGTFFHSELGQAVMGGDRAALRTAMHEFFVPKQRQILEDACAAAADAEALIYNEGYFAALCLAESLGIPAIIATPIPFLSATATFAYPPLTARNLGAVLNRLSYHLFRLTTQRTASTVRGWCQDTLGRPAPSRLRNYLLRNGAPVPVLYAASRHLLPPPRGWHDAVCLSGYWFGRPASAWQPPPELERFLKAGPPPVYVGFGSMPGANPEGRTKIVAAALERAGQRGVLATGWGGLADPGDLPATMHMIDAAPHDWLFPRVRAVVHSGGAGTVTRSARHGKPMVVCPIADDQPFWGRRVYEGGLGPRPIPQLSRRRFTVERLAAAVETAATDPAMAARARVVADLVNAEDGVGEATRFVNAQVERWLRRR